MTHKILTLPLLIVLLLLTLLPASSTATHAAPRCFDAENPAITDCIDGRIQSFWEQQGGLPVFGYPLTPAYQEQTDAGPITVQWFEYARLEHHPHNPPPYNVLLGRLGVDTLTRRSVPPAQPEAPRVGCRFFPETGQNLCPPFLQTWLQSGLELGDPGVSQGESLARFGAPLGPSQTQRRPDGQMITVQWFERARLEDHGAAGVQVGPLGRETIAPETIQYTTLEQSAPLPPGGFIEAAGDQLTRLGQPVQLKGINYYPQGRPWVAMWQDWDAYQMERELRLARDQLGINTVRILYPFEQSFRSSRDHKMDGLMLNRLKEFVQIAGDLDLRLIVTLFDFYNGFPAAGTPEAEDNLTYLRTLIGNFAGDDRIFAWDLHNEPDHYPMWQEGNAAQVLDWLGRMADEVHRLAPHHLVTVGMGQYNHFWQPGPDGRRVIDYSDVISVHIYNAPDAIRQLDEVRRYTNKPILLQEFGWPSGPKCSTQDYNEVYQEQVYRTILEAAQGRVVGIFAWTLRDYDAGPTGRWDTREEHYGLYRPDDSLKPAALLFQGYDVPLLPSSIKTNLPLTTTNPRPPRGEKAPRIIPETGHYIKDWYRVAWQEFGGVVSFGLPLSEAFIRPEDNRVVQYFEAGVFEIVPYAEQHPQFHLMTRAEQAMLMVRPVELGRDVTAGRSFPQGVNVAPNGRRFPETGYTVGGAFLGFYDGINGPWRLGFPLSEEVIEDIDGVPTVVQYFEKGRLEWDSNAGVVSIGQLGTQFWDDRCQAKGDIGSR
jgi:hypothetical protein